MKLTKEELSLLNVSVRTVYDEKQLRERSHPIDRIKTAVSVVEKLMGSTEGTGDMRKFVDGEAEFTTSEKSYLLELIDRPWSVEMGAAYCSVAEKLA